MDLQTLKRMHQNWMSFSDISSKTGSSSISKIRNDFVSYFICPNHPIKLLNCVADYHCDQLDKSIIEEIRTIFESKNLLDTWMVIPELNPANAGKQLLDMGYVLQDTEPHMLYQHSKADIISFEREIKESKLIIKHVTEQNLIDFTNTLLEGYEVPNEYVEKFKNLYLNTFCNKEVLGLMNHFLGYIDGTPVSTSTLIYNADMAGIYNITTLPHHRRKGYGRIMTIDLIVKADSHKYSQSVLNASTMGKPLYEKIGFKTKYERQTFSRKK